MAARVPLDNALSSTSTMLYEIGDYYYYYIFFVEAISVSAAGESDDTEFRQNKLIRTT